MIGSDQFDPADQCGLGRVSGRQNQLATGIAAGQRHRQHALYRSQLAGQRQLADALAVGQCLCRNLPACRQQPEGDGQIKAAAILGQIGGRQADGDALAARELQLRVQQRAAHPVLAFTDRRFRQADQGQAGHTVGKMDFDLDGRRVDTQTRAAVDGGQGHDRSLINT